MRLLLVDNYDSFTYNLAHLLAEHLPVDVFRNQEIPWDHLSQYSHICLSPGPGLPQDAGEMMKLIDHCYHQKPILGVCLGMQALAIHHGASLYNQKKVRHGLSRTIKIEQGESILFQNLPKSLEVGLYHSWAINENEIHQPWKITARSEEGVLMAMEAPELGHAGVQFHPESIMTPSGKEMVRNWLARTSG